jgi:hypothetical protein
MENFFAIFPHNGKNVSTLWKKEAYFSTQWKNFCRFFHTMEKVSSPGFRLSLLLLFVSWFSLPTGSGFTPPGG